MRPISAPVKRLLDARPDVCQRRLVFRDHDCQGRLTREHALIYGGRQVDEGFAIIKICAWAHDVDEFQDAGNCDKEKNVYIALSQATEDDFNRYPKADWRRRLEYLQGKFFGK